MAEGWPQLWRLIESYRYDFQENAGWHFAGVAHLFGLRGIAAWVKQEEAVEMQASITKIEQARLKKCEEKIERGLETFFEVGAALLEIRDTRLYRGGYSTFEDYCRERWGMSRQRAHQYIEASEVVGNLSTIVDIPSTESQARELVALKPEYQAGAWARVLENAHGRGNGKITASDIRKVVEGMPDIEKRVVKLISKEIRNDELIDRKKARLENFKGNETPELDENFGRFPIIYSDPPWRYELNKAGDRAVENHYPTMALEEIKALPVQNIAREDCILFLWAPSPKVGEAMEVLTAWGFTYRTKMVWIKDKIGMGIWVCQQHESLLIATMGSPPAPMPGTQPASVIHAPRGQHSVKPDVFYEIIEKLYPDTARIELFLRGKPREGWEGWGNEADVGTGTLGCSA